MKTTRTVTTGLAGAALVLLASACGQGNASTAASSPPSSAKPPASASACTTALENAGLDAIVQGAAHGGKYPPPVNQACDGLPPGAMKAAVNTAMAHLTGGTP